MSYTSTVDRGNWLAICDDCGKEYKASELRKRWDGLLVCVRTCYEERPMQDFVRAGVDHMAPPWVRPETSDTFIDNFGVIAGSTVDMFGNSTINNFVLTDYITPSDNTNVVVDIPEGVTITGSFSIGSGWNTGTKITITNHGKVQVIPNVPNNTNIVINGIPLGKQVTTPTYTIYYNGNFPPPVLVFDVQPSNAAPNTSISPAVQVWVVGNLSIAITNLVFQIQLSIGSNPGSPAGTLSGTLVQTTSGGVATFSDLQIDKAGNGYTLVASIV